MKICRKVYWNVFASCCNSQWKSFQSANVFLCVHLIAFRIKSRVALRCLEMEEFNVNAVISNSTNYL